MRPDEARRFLERIYETHEHELDCAGLMEVVDRYVEVEARGEDGTQVDPDVPHHLFICADCAELVTTLTQLVKLEDSGRLPQVDELWAELQSAAAPKLRAEPCQSDPTVSPSLLNRVRRWIRPG